VSGRRKTTATTIGTSACGQLALVLSGVLSARLLGVHDRGQLALLVAVPLALTVLTGLGLPFALTFFMARDKASSRHVLAQVRPLIALQLAATTALHVAVLAALIDLGSLKDWSAAGLTIPSSAALLAQQYGQGILQGQHAFRAFNISRLLPALLYALAVLATVAAGGDSLASFGLAWTGAVVVAAIVTGVWAMHAMPREHPGEHATSLIRAREMVRFGLRGLIGASLPVESFQIDQLTVGIALGPSALGIYVVAAAFTNLPRFVSQGIGMVAFPDIAYAANRGSARRLAASFVWLSLLVLVPLVIALELAAPTLVRLFFGAQFAGSIPIARILLLAATAVGIRRVLADVSRGAGHPGYGSVAEIASWLALGGALAGLLGPYGTRGVAWSMCAAAVFGLLTIALLGVLGPNRARTLARKGLTESAALALALLVGLGLVAGADRLPITSLTILPFVTILVGSAPIVFRTVRGRFDWFEPILAGCAMLIILFGIRPLVMVLGHRTEYLGSFDTRPFLFRVEALGLLATVVFVIAYEVVCRRRIPAQHGRRLAPDRRSAALAIGWVFVSVAVLLFVVQLSRGSSLTGSLKLILAGNSKALRDLFANSSEYLSSSPVLGTCAALLILLAVGRSRMLRQERWFVYLASALPTLVFLALGNRRFIIPAVGIPLLVRLLMLGRRPRSRFVVTVVPIIFILLATIPFARAVGARQQHGGALPIFRAAFSEPFSVVNDFFTGPDTEMPNALALELSAFDRGRLAHAHGMATFGDLAIAPVPHVLFPKPVTQRNRMLIATTGAPCDAVAGGLCPDFSVVGTFYQDFGAVGVLLGMLLFGGASGAIWKRVIAEGSSKDPALILLAGCWTVFVPIIMRAGFMPAFAWFLYFYLPTRLALATLVWDPRPSMATRAEART
jgi:O-antigen/teichoic acid export membrane protein